MRGHRNKTLETLISHKSSTPSHLEHDGTGRERVTCRAEDDECGQGHVTLTTALKHFSSHVISSPKQSLTRRLDVTAARLGESISLVNHLSWVKGGHAMNVEDPLGASTNCEYVGQSNDPDVGVEHIKGDAYYSCMDTTPLV
ncbi:hypothetical protein RIF29_20715 [Crotalaria pallida]|uniref:Uncharacterized protein n=1 Tax=Crotalaria pallida TaxID=3830 RepID=A0AAN9F208_CROPI